MSSSIFLSHKSAIFNPASRMWAAFGTWFKIRKSRDDANTTLTTAFYYLSESKKKPLLWTTETTIFIRIIGRTSYNEDNHIFDSKQVLIETCYDTTQTTTFWILAETFTHTIYILQLQQPVHRMKMKILMLQCTVYNWNNSNNHRHNIDNYFLKNFDFIVQKWNNSSNYFFYW